MEISEQVDATTTTTTKETYWYNISNNEVVDSAINDEFKNPTVRYTIGASSLEAYSTNYTTACYQELSIPYTYDGATHTNAHTITSIKLTLHVHQKDYLRMGDDFSRYSTGEVNGKLGDYATESIYAAHQITGETL